MEEYLKLERLTKVFKNNSKTSVVAVKDFNLTVNKGEFITLLGPSGCGKTTVLRMIAGLEQQTHGDIYVSGELINDQLPSKRSMTMVFQNYALFPHLNIFDNIAYGLKIKKKPQDVIENDVAMATQVVNLVGLEERFPGELSGGQQQRAALARGLVLKPDLILFDEPLSNLDLKLRVQTRTEIKRVQQMLGVTVIYVTHDQSEALSMSDRVVIMNHGRIVQEGTPEDVYYKPKNIFISDFIGNANFINAVVEEIEGNLITVELQDKHIVLEYDGEETFSEGEEINLSIKPEAVIFSESPEDFAATVDVRFFLGTTTEYILMFDGSFINLLQSNSIKQNAEYEPGSKVYIKFNKNHFHIYKK